MSLRVSRLALVALPLIAVLGAASLVTAKDNANDPVRCEVSASASGRMIAIQGLVHSSVAVGGTYSLQVHSATAGGNSDVRQGGAFSANPGDSIVLGNVMVGANGIYDVTLSIDAPGANMDCVERFGA